MLRVERTEGCWEWRGLHDPRTGVTRFAVKRGGRSISTTAQRRAYELFIGEPPTGTRITNICGNRNCVNPEHLVVLDPELLFLRHVEKTDDCWYWRGSIDVRGYGAVKRGGRPLGKAHRLAYELFVGPIPEGLELHHACGVKVCVRPDHLQPVTHSEHMRLEWALRAAARP